MAGIKVGTGGPRDPDVADHHEIRVPRPRFLRVGILILFFSLEFS
jgi:hypothetical protein